MLSIVLGYSARGREVTPTVLYIGHERDLALAALEAGAPGVIRTEYFPHLPLASKSRTFPETSAPQEQPAAQVEQPAEQVEQPAVDTEAPAEELPEMLDPDLDLSLDADPQDLPTGELPAPWEEDSPPPPATEEPAAGKKKK